MKSMVRPLLQMPGHDRLRDPVCDRRHAQHADPAAMRLGDLHRPDRGRQVGPRAHPIPDLVEVVRKIGLELLEILTVHSRRALVGPDPPPRLPDHQLGDRKRLVFGLWHVASPPPRTRRPRLNESTFLISRPLRSTPTPDSRSFTATTGRSASERRVGTQCLRVSCRRHAPSRDLGGLRPRSPYRRSLSHVPCQSRRPGSRRLHAGHRLASNRDARQAHHERTARPLAFDATSIFLTTPQQRTPTPRLPGRALLERLPGPHLTRQARLLPIAHHDGLQPTQHRVVWRPPPKDDAGGPTSLHLQHSTAYERCRLHDVLLQRS